MWYAVLRTKSSRILPSLSRASFCPFCIWLTSFRRVPFPFLLCNSICVSGLFRSLLYVSPSTSPFQTRMSFAQAVSPPFPYQIILCLGEQRYACIRPFPLAFPIWLPLVRWQINISVSWLTDWLTEKLKKQSQIDENKTEPRWEAAESTK